MPVKGGAFPSADCSLLAWSSSIDVGEARVSSGCGRPKRMPFLSPLPTRSSRSLPHPAAFPCSRRLRRSTGGAPSYSCSASASASAGPGRAVGNTTRGARSTIEAPRRRWLPGLLATAVVLSSSSVPALLQASTPPPADATLEDVPQTLSGGGAAPKKRIQKPKSSEAERCTGKCVGTCIQGGAGSPGEGPFNVRRPLVVFKSGFRSRNYCLVECSDICNLIKDGDDGP